MVACKSKIAVIALAISYAQETASEHAESMTPYKVRLYCDTVHLISHGLRISKSSGCQAFIDDLRSISASEEIEIEIRSRIGALLVISWPESLAGRDRPSTGQEFMKGEYAAVLKRYR
ncbi:hypothetical protein VF21_05285 [Pseudogymnoascus sp. 05NY08]|nr:hypothetical protein VF21_05285 [Pseudogymnoascus sp. 05NY08]